jgi:hypothetical protein
MGLLAVKFTFQGMAPVPLLLPLFARRGCAFVMVQTSPALLLLGQHVVVFVEAWAAAAAAVLDMLEQEAACGKQVGRQQQVLVPLAMTVTQAAAKVD